MTEGRNGRIKLLTKIEVLGNLLFGYPYFSIYQKEKGRKRGMEGGRKEGEKGRRERE